MDTELLEYLKNLEVHPLGDNGEIDILPASEKNILSTSQLPCGLPPVLPDTTSLLKSFLESPEKLPLFDLDAVQKFIPVEPDISSLYSVELCPLQTTLCVKRNMKTGKLLKFTEEVKDASEGTHKTSFSLSRAPGPPEAGVKGSSSSFPFWPGGMDEPWADILKQEKIDNFQFDEELLDTPPGFKCGMKFPKMSYDQVDYMHSQPQKIYLSDVLAMEDSEFTYLSEPEDDGDELPKEEEEKNGVSENEDILKITSLPVLNIKDYAPKPKQVISKWAVVEDVNKKFEDFKERIPEMARTWTFELDSFQKCAILHLEKKENVFVAAHTSAGKTVVAEYAVALAKKNVTKVIYTSPIKALSNQKYKDFREIFGDVGLITGDVQLNPTAFCLIMTTEILRSMLYNGSDLIRELEWVVFDEVHYINDPERGGVWEEVFIMLPDHVSLIMLSATVPNTAEFAEWLGGIKKRKIYVINTTKRPVDLEYFLYTGSAGKFVDEIFPIVDTSGKFLDNEYLKASKAKKDRESKAKAAYGPKGSRQNVPASQEKNIYLGLIYHLQKRDLLPAICFTFSRKRCKQQAEYLKSVDLTTKSQKSKITEFINNSLKALKAEDRELPQVMSLREMLNRGFGIHHSGILPIMKEIVEMLVKEKLVQVLFTTETFAMGVNMPARTVVFDSIRKHDGTCFRDLLPSEFIQMAGRAGRRGIDHTGNVILLCKGDIPESSSLRSIILGKPMALQSQFKLTYRMILNLLKLRTFRVEDVMKRSFGECKNQEGKKKFDQLLSDATNQLNNLKKPECSLCTVDLENYCHCLNEVVSTKKEVMLKKCMVAYSSKILVSGRIVSVFANQQNNVPGVVLNVDKEYTCKVLIISDKNRSKTSENLENRVVPWTKQLFYPHEKIPEVVVITFGDIQVIANKVLRIQENDILKDWLQVKMGKTKLGHSISSTFQDLCTFAEGNLKGFSSANITFKEMNLVNTICDLESLETSLETSTCIKCPEFNKHFSEMYDYLTLKNQIHRYKFLISEESLTLHPEYEKRKQVLKIMDYIGEDDTVKLKGQVAREMSNHELLITELFVKSVFNDCSPEQVAALLSCMVFQQKSEDELPKDSALRQKVKEIESIAEDISKVQNSCGIIEDNFVQQYNFGLTGVVYDWANGTTFAEIMNTTEVEEGIIVRTIQRLSELLKEVRKGAKLVGDPVLAEKMDQAMQKIKRDIVFAASLYTLDTKQRSS